MKEASNKSLKTSTVALVITYESGMPLWMDTISDEREIQYIEEALRAGDPQPLHKVYEIRATESRQVDDFGDSIEDLFTTPYVSSEAQKQALKWLHSKIKIEKYQKIEKEAARVISEYAYKIFQEDPSQTDFFIAGPQCQVRIRIFTLPFVKSTAA